MNLWLYLLGINAFTAFLYWFDKRAARNRGWRVSEAVLLMVGFAGGTIAAFVAQQVFRHKTKKTRFQLAFWAVTMLQLYLLFTMPDWLRWILWKLAA